MTIIQCDYRNQCELSNLPQSQATGYFQPRNTGEHCDHYIPIVTKEEDDAWGNLADRMGVLE